MSIAWLAPAALAGLGLIALPIAIHLLVRQQSRTLPYPSLRFLRETQLAAFRRRRIEDAALLACRVAIVAAAAAALAGPILQTPRRTASYASRTSRAVVMTESLPGESIANLETGAFRTMRVRRTRVADAFTDAVRWLDEQPRSSREIVVAGALRRGSIEAADLAAVPRDIGIRFEQSGADGPADQQLSVLVRREGQLMRVERTARLTAEATRVSDGPATPVAANLVTISARPADTALAEAALRAALDSGIVWRDFERRVAVVWAGGSEAAIPGGAEIIRMPVPAPPSSAASAVAAALTEMSGVNRVEPIAIARPQLDEWSRRPGTPALDAPVADEGDRRWLWGLALAFLGLEWWLRRSRANGASIATNTEARVA